MNSRRRVEIHSQKPLLDDSFKVNEVIISHQRYDGKMSLDQRRLVFERGDAVAALLFDIDTHSVVLVEQFRGSEPDRPPTRRSSTTNGWITEVLAGMINDTETAEDAVIRETLEETGYQIKKH
jgi:nudix-type nucleoside diphosphatase (YffH/AdpP family)